MTTVDKTFADKLVALNGQFSDDEPIIKIVEYDNNWGGQGYGLVYAGKQDRYQHNPPFVRNPRIYWALPEKDKS